jgi:radical SAM-linked protein
MCASFWVVINVAEVFFRLRINFQKKGALRFLSHLELVRALERTIRRAQLPYAISCGFNAHMRHAPGPALPVGTIGLDEYFDVWLTEYLKPTEALIRLKQVDSPDLNVIGVTYVDPKAKGLQATHTHEAYEIILKTDTVDTSAIREAIERLLTTGKLTVQRKNKQKVYDLTQSVESAPTITELKEGRTLVTLHLQSTTQGSIRPELLINTALGENACSTIESITRTKLSEDI